MYMLSDVFYQCARRLTKVVIDHSNLYNSSQRSYIISLNEIGLTDIIIMTWTFVSDLAKIATKTSVQNAL